MRLPDAEPQLPISRSEPDWLISRVMNRVFFLCSLLVIAVTPLLRGSVAVAQMSFSQRLLLTILVGLGPPGLFCIWIGMWVYWVYSASSAGAKRAWFFVLLIGFWYGSVIYYFFSYRAEVIRKREMEA